MNIFYTSIHLRIGEYLHSTVVTEPVSTGRLDRVSYKKSARGASILGDTLTASALYLRVQYTISRHYSQNQSWGSKLRQDFKKSSHRLRNRAAGFSVGFPQTAHVHGAHANVTYSLVWGAVCFKIYHSAIFVYHAHYLYIDCISTVLFIYQPLHLLYPPGYLYIDRNIYYIDDVICISA